MNLTLRIIDVSCDDSAALTPIIEQFFGASKNGVARPALVESQPAIAAPKLKPGPKAKPKPSTVDAAVTPRVGGRKRIDHAKAWKQIQKLQRQGKTQKQMAAELGMSLSRLNTIATRGKNGLLDADEDPQDDLNEDHPARVTREKERFNREIMAGK